MNYRIVITFICVFIQASLFASEPSTYYGKKMEDIMAGQLAGKELKKYLHFVLDSYHTRVEDGYDLIDRECDLSIYKCYKHKSYNYTQARIELMGHLHLEEASGEYRINTVYCNYDLGPEDFNYGPAPAPGIIPDSGIINTEHTWPQSKFSKKYPKTIQKSDLHALYPTNPGINTTRSNLDFGEVGQISSPTCEGTKVGFLDLVRARRYFEPPDFHKGNVARSLFYFATRYNLHISKIQEEFIRKWHKLDPVDDFERWRHEEIFKFQKVRNPFVDHPWLVNLINDF